MADEGGLGIVKKNVMSRELHRDYQLGHWGSVVVVVGCTAEEEYSGTGADTVAVGGAAVEALDVTKTTKALDLAP